jgi:hypothetical protein
MTKKETFEPDNTSAFSGLVGADDDRLQLLLSDPFLAF